MTEAVAPGPAPVLGYVGLGANLGDAPAALATAVAALHAVPGVRVQRLSRLYRSAPVDAAGPDFYNAVIELESSLPPHALLAALQSIELAAGRERPYRHAPRTLDLDLLMLGDHQLDTPTLTLPHPRWAQRAFVLLPLADLAPGRVSPALYAAVADQRIDAVSVPAWQAGAYSI